MEEDTKNSSARDQDNDQDSSSKKGKGDSSAKTILLSIAVVVSILLVAGGAYWAGMNKNQVASTEDESVASETAESKTEEEVMMDAEEEEAEVITPSPTATPEPTPTPTPKEENKTFDSSAPIDGFQASNGGGNNAIEVRVGRNSLLIIRGFVSFGIGDIPEGATIKKATLKLYQVQLLGNPFSAGLRVMLDHLDYGDTFENADYNTPSISTSFATLSDSVGAGWRTIDVTDQVRNDLENDRERSQYRLHMAVENTGGTITGDYVYFESQNNSLGTNNTPQLVVEYSYFE